MSFVLWIKITVSLRLNKGEVLTLLLARKGKEGLVPMTGAFMARMDKLYSPVLGWVKATIHSRRRGFATAAVRCGIHMASICIAMRHSQGVTMQYIALSLSEKAAMTTRLAIAAYDQEKTVKEQLQHISRRGR